MPGACDAGSVDLAALAGLAAAMDWLEEPAQADRLAVARDRVERIARALERRPGVRLHGVRDPARRLPTIAFTVAGRASADVAAHFRRHGVLVASGLQCAPRAHEALGTAPDGVVRVSAGSLVGEADVAVACEVVAAL
jgi:selenocysteine lyase/cysteine desulfurase